MFKLLTLILIFIIAVIGCSPYKNYLRTIEAQIEQTNNPTELDRIAIELSQKSKDAPESQASYGASGPKEAYLKLYRRAILKRDQLMKRVELEKKRVELEGNFQDLKNKKFDEIIANLNIIPTESVVVSADTYAHKFRIECDTEFDYSNPNRNDYYELMLFVNPNGIIYQVVYELKTTLK